MSKLKTAVVAAVLALTVGVVMMTTGAFGANVNSGTFNMKAGAALNVTCPNSLTNTNVLSRSETVNCAAGATTTTTGATTTTVPSTTTTPTTAPSTTTTVPATTTTVPSSGGMCTNPVFTSSANSFQWYAPGETTTYVNNDTWNTAEAGPQTMNICSLASWYVLSNQPNLATNPGSVKSYPSVCDCSMPNQPMSAYHTLTSTYAEANTHLGEWDATYDTFTNSNEIMIQNDQNNHGNGVQQGGTPVTIDGVAYHVTAGGSGFVCFVADSNNQSGTVNFLDFYSYVVSRGWDTWSDTLGLFAYGTEISWTESSPGVMGQQRFDNTDFSLTMN